MGRWKVGRRIAGKIVVLSRDKRSVSLIYNLDSKGQLKHPFPVCKGIPGFVKIPHSCTDSFVYSPPRLNISKGAPDDPEIRGTNSVEIPIDKSLVQSNLDAEEGKAKPLALTLPLINNNVDITDMKRFDTTTPIQFEKTDENRDPFEDLEISNYLDSTNDFIHFYDDFF